MKTELLKIQRNNAYLFWKAQVREIKKHEMTTEDIMRLGVLNDRIAEYEQNNMK